MGLEKTFFPFQLIPMLFGLFFLLFELTARCFVIFYVTLCLLDLF